MRHAEIRSLLLDFPDATAGYPFGPGVEVMKVRGKMYATLSDLRVVGGEEQPPRVNLKADPEDIPLLREQYAAIEPGYHMNKRHWNTVVLNGTLPPPLIAELVEQSYRLVVKKGLKKVERELLLAKLADRKAARLA